jgi:CRP/FNR family transcriptional regulator, anaerobic regulatory protein
VLLEQFTGTRHLKRNEFFLREGEYCNEIAFIKSGMMRHFYNSKDGEVTRWVSLEKTLCTSLSGFIRGVPIKENLQAIADTEILLLRKKKFLDLYASHEPFRQLWTRVIEAHYLGMENRVYELIALRADERYGRLFRTHPDFIRKVPNKYLASMLGIEPRHLSRIKRRNK